MSMTLRALEDPLEVGLSLESPSGWRGCDLRLHGGGGGV